MFSDLDNLHAATHPCRPDPEEVLQEIRKERVTVKEAQTLLLALVQTNFYFDTPRARETICAMAGETLFREDRLKIREMDVLKEIDESK